MTLAAGTRLHQLPRLLAPYGLALPNMGDIDRQTIAGATSTGTHGTGLGFGGLATQIVAAKLVTGTGELLTVSETERPELLPAVRLGLGALGVLVEVTLQLVPRVRAAGRRAPRAVRRWCSTSGSTGCASATTSSSTGSRTPTRR